MYISLATLRCLKSAPTPEPPPLRTPPPLPLAALPLPPPVATSSRKAARRAAASLATTSRSCAAVLQDRTALMRSLCLFMEGGKVELWAEK